MKKQTLRKQFLLLGASLLLLAVAASNAGAATATESFDVTVAAELTIAAPLANVAITHDKTDTNQVFAAQQWTVTSNGSAGASVTFETNQAFKLVVGTKTYQRDAKLDLAIASSDAAASWTVSTATDVTDYANATTPDGVATVAAGSTAPGDAAFNLTVTFITTDFSTLASGTYNTTVTGTITAK